MTASEEQRTRGLAAREQLMGQAWVSSADATPGLALFTERAREWVWGTAWGDATLELRLKSVTTLSILIAQGALDELRAHAAGALRAGLLDPDQLRSLALHATCYVGFPSGRHAMVVIDDVIASAG